MNQTARQHYLFLQPSLLFIFYYFFLICFLSLPMFCANHREPGPALHILSAMELGGLPAWPQGAKHTRGSWLRAALLPGMVCSTFMGLSPPLCQQSTVPRAEMSHLVK